MFRMNYFILGTGKLCQKLDHKCFVLQVMFSETSMAWPCSNKTLLWATMVFLHVWNTICMLGTYGGQKRLAGYQFLWTCSE